MQRNPQKSKKRTKQKVRKPNVRSPLWCGHWRAIGIKNWNPPAESKGSEGEESAAPSFHSPSPEGVPLLISTVSDKRKKALPGVKYQGLSQQ